LLDIFINHLVSRKKKPLLASYKITYRCNLHCEQCPFVDYSAPDPSFATICRTLDELWQRGNRLVIFEGGEPLLWHDGAHTLADVVRYAHRRFARVGVTSNGTLPLDVGADILWVSIDGFASTQNRLRGAPIFERVINHLQDVRHLRPYVHVTANRQNSAEIPELVRYLATVANGISVQFYYPYGEDDHLFLDWPERRWLLTQLSQLKREGLPILNSFAALAALQRNHWTCQPWRIDCATPEGKLWNGCYVSGRGIVDCRRCGFSPYTEMSLAFQGNPQAVLAGMKIFRLGLWHTRTAGD
jgi:MoaA/NifB/PqqE/SkfB family radical SAM enzyme